MTDGYTPIPGPEVFSIIAIAEQTTDVLGEPVDSWKIVGQRGGLGFVEYEIIGGKRYTVGYPIR